ncbi:MAG TPA: DUF3710 domain-containing protein [Streptosporangiaceae bacterium]|nr:DUF3710 domain-containing protein [Streptosporangiaceae bacterium]
MFRRRKSGQPEPDSGQAEPVQAGPGFPDEQFADEAFAEQAFAEFRGAPAAPAGLPRAEGGPWDSGEPFPDRDRVDLGSLLVPVGPEHEVQLVMAEQHGAWVTVHHGGSELQIQAFAAPRSGALWDEIRPEIAAEVRQAGGSSSESQGTFGVALDALVPADPAEPSAGLRPVRFIGVDGPRWFLRGLLSGPAAEGEPSPLLEAVFADVVVARGDYPAPPRDLLVLRLPPDAQQAIAEQMAAQQQEEQSPYVSLDPFERGPEITETR